MENENQNAGDPKMTELESRIFAMHKSGMTYPDMLNELRREGVNEETFRNAFTRMMGKILENSRALPGDENNSGNKMNTNDVFGTSPEDQIKQLKRSQGQNQIISGILIFAVGLIITLVSYQAAKANGGGSYFITWGLMVVGVIRIIKGMISL